LPERIEKSENPDLVCVPPPNLSCPDKFPPQRNFIYFSVEILISMEGYNQIIRIEKDIYLKKSPLNKRRRGAHALASGPSHASNEESAQLTADLPGLCGNLDLRTI